MDTNEKDLAPAEALQRVAEQPDGELSDDDLDGVSGGFDTLTSSVIQNKHDTAKQTINNIR